MRMAAAFHNLFKDPAVIQYFKNLYYYKDDRFFSLNKYASDGDSTRLYMTDEALYDWKEQVENDGLFSPEKSYRELLQKRKGEYSNATLYSSSRMAVELFSDKKNINRLLTNLNIDKPADHIELEHLFSIKGLNTNSNMDVCIWCENTLIAIECKMQEIYSGNELFQPSYKNILERLNFSTIDKTTKLGIQGFTGEMTALNYKQQICHLLGLANYKTESKGTKKKIVFVNLVFDPGFLPLNEKDADYHRIVNRYVQYKSEERAFFEDSRINALLDDVGEKVLINQNMEIVR